MKYKKKKSGLVGDVMKLSGGAIVTGAASAGIAKMGVPAGTATHIQSGLGSVGTGIGMVGTMLPLKYAAKSLKKIKRFK